MAATTMPSALQVWKDPAMQKSAAIVRKAYPSDAIAAPANPNSPQAASNGSDTTYAAVEAACVYLALFAKIADARREESDSVELHQGGLSAEKCHPSR